MPFTVDVNENLFLKGVYTKGLAEGKAEGKAEGEARGKAETLLRLLSRRFGSPSSEIREKVFAADTETLDGWLDRLLDEPNLEALFPSSGPH
ncbi:hypothetical protein WCLP8_2180003 [uncultured Gammaproteobacteria bacterium]